MGGLPPGCTQSECDQAQPGYYDDDINPDEFEEEDAEMFDASQAQSKFIEALKAIEFGQLGIGIDPSGLKLRGAAIALAGELFAKFIKELAEDADASMSIGRVHASDTGFIADTCHDIAGQIVNGAERYMEAAE